MSLKHYLLEVIVECGDGNPSREDAVEYAILSDWVSLTYNKKQDVQLITRQLPHIVDRFAEECRKQQLTHA